MGLAYRAGECDNAKTWAKSSIDYFIMLVVSILFTIGLFPLNRSMYEESGISKFLDREIVIDKTEITYDSQGQPIDTVYYYVRARNNN